MGCQCVPMTKHVPTPVAFRFAVAWFLGWAMAAATTATAAVYRCDGDDGPPSFSQFPCGEGAVVAVEPLRTVRMPPLSESEQHLLDDLEQQQRAAHEQRARARRQAARHARAERKKRRKRCEAARIARAALQQQRRKGYGIDQARELDRRGEALEAEEKHNC